MELSDEFVNTHIDTENQNSENFQNDEKFSKEGVKQKKLKNMIGGKDIIQLKSNYIPKGFIPLEKLFDQNYVAKYPKVQPNENNIQDQNIGIEDSLKVVKLSRNLSIEEKINILT